MPGGARPLVRAIGSLMAHLGKASHAQQVFCRTPPTSAHALAGLQTQLDLVPTPAPEAPRASKRLRDVDAPAGPSPTRCWRWRARRRRAR